MRAFVGLPLPEDLIEALGRVQAGLGVGRAVPPENLHLTLAFLDDQPETALAALDAELQAIAGPVPEVRIAGLDLVGGSDAVRLLMAAVAPDPALAALRKRVRGAARAAGIGLKRERFRPHVTLARFRRRQAPGEPVRIADFLAREGGFSWPGFAAGEFVLYRSTLTPEGALYDPLAVYTLG